MYKDENLRLCLHPLSSWLVEYVGKDHTRYMPWRKRIVSEVLLSLKGEMLIFWVELGELVLGIVLLVLLVGYIQAASSNYTCTSLLQDLT